MKVLAGRYHIVKPLGKGGFGQTFLAEDIHLPGRPICVVKQLRLGSKDSQALATAKRLFDLEAETLYKLGNHDQIPRLLAHFEQEDEFYLVQEYVEGQLLFHELGQGPLSETAAIALLQDLLQVLAFVHQQGVIHRDIKPANLIRRSRDRRIVLIDFGAVKQISTQTLNPAERELTVAIGSAGYMPIEQQLFQPRLSSDVYAVGMVVLQALTGIAPVDFPRHPETGEVDCQAVSQFAQQFSPHGQGITIRPELAAILNKMVHDDCRQRYANATEALTAIAAIAPSVDLDQILPPALPLTLPPKSAIIPAADPLPPLFSPSTQPQLPASTVAPPPTPTPPVASPAAPHAPISRRRYRNRQALLNKVNTFWVQGVLDAALHEQVLMALGLEAHPEAVTSPWNIALETRSQQPQALPPGSSVVSVFDQIGVGRSLLILGEPGAGKTTQLLQLARELLKRALQDDEALIPVVLNLASWANVKRSPTRQTLGVSFAHWLVEELRLKYQVPQKIGRPWVEQQQLLLLLDGLDEVRSDAREACVAAINQFQQDYGTEMVVCSRIKDYELLSNRLNFQTAIYLKALTTAQAQQYLTTLNADLGELQTLLAHDPALQDLARSPLMLNIMVLAYQGIRPQALPQTQTLEKRRQQLFDSYIERMLARRSGQQSYPPDQTIAWLSWLAQRMMQQSQTVFLIERLQPAWLETQRQRSLYRILAALIAGLGWGISFGLISRLVFVLVELSHHELTQVMVTDKLIDGLIVGVVNGLLVGVALALLQPNIKPVETLKWSWKYALRGLAIWMPFGFGSGLTGGLIVEVLHRLIDGVPVVNAQLINPMDGWIGVIAGCIYGLTYGLVGSEIETKIVPNQAIWISLISASRFGMAGAMLGALGGVGAGLATGQLVNGIISGLSIGLMVGLVGGGGLTCIKHFTLRLMLQIQNAMPWNYTQFLNYASDRIFLQKVGGGYIFMHRLLMEHFANLRA